MADIVGTAFVRIKALTNDLAKDIESGFSKGVKDAKIEPAGAKIGDDLVKGTSKTIEKDAGSSIKDSLTKAVSKGDFKKASGLLARKMSDDFNASFKIKFDKAIEAGDFNKAQSLIKKKLNLEKIADSSAEGFFNEFKRKIDSLFTEDSGKKSGEKFGKGLGGKIAPLAALFSPAILGIGSLLVQYVTALVSQVGLLVVAAAGAGVALGTVFGAAALSILPVFLAFKAKTPELAKFMETAKGVKNSFLEIGAATQETLLPGLTRALIIATNMIPVFRGFGREVGLIVGKFAQLVASDIVGNMDRLRAILQGSARIFENLTGIARNFINIVLNLFRSALPIGEKFAASIKTISDRWNFMIGASSASGKLTATLSDWYSKAVLVGGALGDLFVALFNVLSAGSNSAVPFFDNFATWAQGFRDFTASVAGKNKLKQIFDDANAVAHEFNGLVVDIINAIGGQVFAPGGNNGIVGFIQIIRKDFIPLLDGFTTALKGTYGPALSDFFAAFSGLVAQIVTAHSLDLTLQTLTIALNSFTAALKEMAKIPGLTAFLGFLLSFGGALLVVEKALSLIGGNKIKAALTPLIGLIGDLAGGFGAVIAGEATFAAGFGEAIVGGGVLATLGAVAAAIAVVVAAVVAVVVVWKNWSTIVRFIKDPMERLQALDKATGRLLHTLLELGGKALGAVGRALGSVGHAFANLGGIIKDKVGQAFDAFIELIKSLPKRAVGALADLAGAFIHLESVIIRAEVRLGKTIITGIINGIKALPGALLRALDAAFHFAFEALKQIILRSIQVVLIGIFAIPFLIVQGLILLGPVLVRAFSSAFDFLKGALGPIVGSVLNFFQDLPGNIIEQLSNLGSAIASFFSNVAWPFVTSAVSTAIDSTIQFFKDLPGNAVNALIGLGDLIAGAFTGGLDTAKNLVSTGIAAIIQFFKDLPGNILSAVTTLGDTILSIGSTIIEKLLEGLGAAPGKIVELAGAIFDAVRNLGKSLINGVIGALNDLLPDKIPGVHETIAGHTFTILPDINLPNDPIPPLGASGGIFRRATNIIIGEAGAEVLIPLTNPRRALELFDKSGLSGVLQHALRGRDSASNLSATLDHSSLIGIAGATKTGRRVGGDMIIQQMNIEAPTPLEASHQVAARLRIMQAQLVSG